MFDWGKYQQDVSNYTNSGLRRGQACMIATREQSQDFYNQATQLPFDPYYDDNKIEAFEDWLAAMAFGR